MTTTQPTMTKKSGNTTRVIRPTMEAIREMMNTRGAFQSKAITVKHRAPAATSSALAMLGWLETRRGVGSKWIGPKPQDEVRLREMAVKTLDAARDVERYYQARKKADKKSDVKKPVAIPPNMGKGDVWNPADSVQFVNEQPQYIGPAPEKKPKPAKKKRVSILWGLISWDK